VCVLPRDPPLDGTTPFRDEFATRDNEDGRWRPAPSSAGGKRYANSVLFLGGLIDTLKSREERRGSRRRIQSAGILHRGQPQKRGLPTTQVPDLLNARGNTGFSP
jgi:hypothetical protein